MPISSMVVLTELLPATETTGVYLCSKNDLRGLNFFRNAGEKPIVEQISLNHENDVENGEDLCPAPVPCHSVTFVLCHVETSLERSSVQ